MSACGMSRCHLVRGDLGLQRARPVLLVILPRLGGSFGNVAVVAVRGDSLEVNVVLL
jgi:hypothetical protein